MKTSHLTTRAPHQNGGFSWGRYVFDQGTEKPPMVVYRLFRRDHRGKLHMAVLTFSKGESRAAMGAAAKKKRHTLRDQVDEIDLAAMGIAA